MAKFRQKNKKNQNRSVLKTRKEVRKQKREQKKLNKKNFFEQKKRKVGQFVKSPNANTAANSVGAPNNKIETNFVTSEGKVNDQQPKVIKQNRQQSHVDKIMKQQKEKQILQKKMKKRRIEQLNSANEEEDKIIRKLEKQLKIHKHDNSKSIPKMFKDGLDYALEMCLPQNIEKMYVAAKKGENINGSDEDLREDFETVLEEFVAQEKDMDLNGSNTKKLKNEKPIEGKKTERKRYQEDLDSDLGSIDSEYNNSEFYNENTFKDSDNSDFDIIDNEALTASGTDDDYDLTSEKRSVCAHKLIVETKSKSNDKYYKSENAKTYSEFQKKGKGNSDKLKKSKNILKDKDNANYEGGNFKNEETIHGVKNKYNQSTKRHIKSKDNSGENFSNYKEKAENDGNIDFAGNNSRSNSGNSPNGGILEDIYGRIRNEEGNIVEEKTQKYVPPHIRIRIESDSNEKHKEKQLFLRRRCKGHLNRLSEANMHKITSEMEILYMDNARYDMNKALSALVIEALIKNVLTPERMVLEYAMLVAILHANIGSEIGAHFLETLVTMFDNLVKKIDILDVENKELDNIVLFLCHMYTFKIFQHSLIYELIDKLICKFHEKSVECLLLILRSIGFMLRKDDPIALKDLIISLQKKANESRVDIKENPRLKFMLDVLYAIKNNNVNKIPQYDPSLAEHLKKILKSMLVNGKYVACLNITMEDLLKADERGKWWVIGSAWSGNIRDIGTTKTNSHSSKTGSKSNEKFSEKLLELAKQQRMNTDDRRDVFCVLMSAADYVDAFERLIHLSIRDHRVIVSVLIHCCLSEKNFNPYYGVLAQKFCEYDRKYQLASQYALWDKIKDVHLLTNLQIKNLAQFLIYLICNGGLPVSVLKVIDFANLEKSTLRLLRQIMLGLLLGKEHDCKRIFERIAPSTKLNIFKDSLRLFLHHFLIKGGNKSQIPAEQKQLLKERVSLVESVLGTECKVQF